MTGRIAPTVLEVIARILDTFFYRYLYDTDRLVESTYVIGQLGRAVSSSEDYVGRTVDPTRIMTLLQTGHDVGPGADNKTPTDSQ